MFKNNILLSLVALVLLASCSSDPSSLDSIYDKTLPQIFSNKSIVNIDENEEVTFTVEYLDIDVTDGAKVINVTTGDTLQGNTVSFEEEMTCEFQAIFKGKLSANKAKVLGAKPTLSDIFYRNHVLLDFTGTWCSNCPAMLKTIKYAIRDYPDRLLPIEVHSGDKLQSDESVALVKQFGVDAFPSLMVDASHNYFHIGGGTTSNRIITSSKESLNENPTVGGIKLDTDIDSNNQITVEVEVSVSQDNEYKLAVALLVDGYEYDQTGVVSGKGSQNHVLHAFLQDKVSGDSLGELEKGQKVEKIFTYDFEALGELPFGITKEDCKIMAYILNKQADGTYLINNATICDLGANVDYRYEYILEEK